MNVIFLDTGYHFAETIGTRDYYADFTDIKLRTILPLRTVEEQNAEHGEKLHDRDPNQCCALRKVEPLERGLAPYTAWVTGMRREDAPTRTDITVVGWDAKRDKVKLNPLAAWTQEQTSTRTWRRTTSCSTRCARPATRRSAAPRARVRWRPVRTLVRAAGPARARSNAGCTREPL